LALHPEPETRQRLPLTRQRVLAAAVELADEAGIDGLSMRRVGQRLGVEAMSLYNHVANKGDLLEGMLDLVLSEIDPPIDDGSDWRRVFAERVMSARRALLRHRWAADVVIGQTNASPQMLAYMDSMVGILRRAGFSLALTHHALHALGSRTLGFTQELFEDSGDGPADPAAAAAMARHFADYPYVAEIVTQVTHDDESVIGSGCDDQFEFEFGLDLLLDGLERLRVGGR
jgi:AcrR family transcriptional regulator